MIRINNRKIGSGEPCFIIAEAGVNHNGSLELAKKLVDVAKEAGADAVKFQTFNAEELLVPEMEKAGYQKETTGKKETQFEMIKKLELSESEFSKLKEYCDSKEILFLSTPFDSKSLEIVDKLCPLFKIASTDTNNYPFLEAVAKKNKPIILSTGMATMEEIKKAVSVIKKTGNTQLILLQCVSAYPTPLEEANVMAMNELKKAGAELVGYSDHTLGNYACFSAVALGARVIEKHYTLDKKMEGPDHQASLEPNELKNLIEGIRKIEKTLGSGEKKPSRSESKNINIMRKKLIAVEEIERGKVVSKELLAIRRASSGASPEEMGNIVGKKTKRKIKKYEGIDKEDVI